MRLVNYPENCFRGYEFIFFWENRLGHYKLNFSTEIKETMDKVQVLMSQPVIKTQGNILESF